MDILGKLQSFDFFKDLSPSLRIFFSKAGRLHKYDKSNILFLEGDIGNCFFVLLEGSIKLYKVAPDGKEVIVKIINPGEIFGEVIIFEEDYYPVSAVSMTKSSALVISKNDFCSGLDNKDFRNSFMAFLMAKQRYLTKRILYLSAYDVEERFFRFLKDNFGEKESYKIDLSKKDFASAIGTIPETFSRLVQRLKKRQIINWDKNHLGLEKNFWNKYSFDD